MTKNLKLATLIASGSVLAAGTGYLASEALSGSSAATPSTTVTVEVTGEQGPPGPPGETGATGATGPAGEGGADSCPTGSVFGEVVFIQQGKGPTTILTCVKSVP